MPSEITIEITPAGASPVSRTVPPGVYTIGRDGDCKIHLKHPSVEPRHAVLILQASEASIEDLDSASGTLVDGIRIRRRAALGSGQAVTIGPFQIVVRAGIPAPVRTSVPPQPIVAAPIAAPQPTPAPAPSPAPAPLPPPRNTIPPQANPAREHKISIKQQIHRALVERLDIKRLATSQISHQELAEKVRTTVQDIVKQVAAKLPAGIAPDVLVKEVCDEALGLGPLEDMLEDPEITEIMVNGPRQIYVEKNGRITLADATFMDDNSVLAVIERIVSPIGRRIDESQPYVDARLPDGSRVNAIIHPLSLIGPCLTIRKFSKVPFTDEDLIRFGTITRNMLDFCRICVVLRKNIIVSGGTGSGKTTFLNVLSSYLPDSDRIVTIEDAAELRLKQVHVVRLEARPPNIEGKGAISIRDLVRNSLRMRPDRIVVGECRGGEALDMLQAMNTGHDGSLTTIHANTPRDVISRLETMVLMSGMDLPVRAIREQIASAVDIIMHESRLSDGSRRIVKISEVVGLEGDQITMQDIFEFEQTGVTPEGKVKGRFRPTGSVPTFAEELESRGLSLDRTMFDPSRKEM